MQRPTRLAAIAGLCLLFWLPVRAQQFDRAKIPPPGRQPTLRVPTWTASKLQNGAELIVSEKHDLPLVSFTITFIGEDLCRNGGGDGQRDRADSARVGSERTDGKYAGCVRER